MTQVFLFSIENPAKLLSFQEEVISVAGEEALELGLLFGTENLTPQEEEMDVFCFQHLMLQEFVAAHFISQQDKVGQSSCQNERKSISRM